MNLIKVDMPSGNDYYDDCAFDEYELERLNGIQVAAYWYGTGIYEGNGHIIYKAKDGLWDHSGLSHCSCYGPTESVTPNGGVYATLDELVAKFSEELKGECQGLIDALKAEGHA